MTPNLDPPAAPTAPGPPRIAAGHPADAALLALLYGVGLRRAERRRPSSPTLRADGERLVIPCVHDDLEMGAQRRTSSPH